MYDLLKPKVTYIIYLCTFLRVGEWNFKSILTLLRPINYAYDDRFFLLLFCLGPIAKWKGSKSEFQISVTLVGYCSFKMDQFVTLKLKSERHLLKLFFEVNKSLEHLMCNLKKRWILSNLNSAFSRNSIVNSPSFFFGRRRIFF